MQKILKIVVIGLYTAFSIYAYNAWISPPNVQANIAPIHKDERVFVMIQKLRPELDPAVCRIISQSIYRNSKEFNIDPALVVAVMNKESQFSPLATSKMDCKGLMQINPIAHRDKLIGINNSEIYHIDNNVRLGCWVLSDYIKQSKSVRTALGRYYGDRGSRKYPDSVLKTYRGLKRGSI